MGAPRCSLDRLDTTADVETPERVRFRYRIAGPGRRGAAWLVDFAVRAVIFAVVAGLVGVFSLIPGLEGPGTGALLLALFLLEWLYGAIVEAATGGRSPGKMLLSLRVVRVDGAPAAWPDFLLRNLLRGVDYLPGLFGVALVSMVLDPRLRRVGDLVAGTVVVVEERTGVLGDVRIAPPVDDDERRALPARVALSRDEIGTIEAFLRRRGRLSDPRAEELATLFGPALSERTGITAPSWERVLTLAYARATGKDR